MGASSESNPGHQFTKNWFDGTAKPVWDYLLPTFDPARILEIGSYEGKSTCYLIETQSEYKSIEIHCIDTWEGGVEHQRAGRNMSEVELRFEHNTRVSLARAKNPVNLKVHKGYSDLEMAKLLAQGMHGYFDFVYVDGSHQAPDVLCDAVLAHRLLKVDGLLIFDDYLWQEDLPTGTDPIRCPKIAIDAFTNIYSRKVRLIKAPLSQLYVQKISD